MTWWTQMAAAVAVLVAVGGGTGILVEALRRRAILDHPNARSSHSVPTPRGGGWALVPAVLAAWAGWGALEMADPTPVWSVCLGAAVLVAVSWADDLRGLAPSVRLAAHFVAVGAALAAMPAGQQVFGGALPLPLDRLAAAVLWVWFINLFNFMDGIDGIAGVETMTIAGGAVLVSLAAGAADLPAAFGLTLAAGALGFLRWNWHPARIFLGDVGSVPVGYLLGWLLLSLAAEGLGSAALILALYYLLDASITLARRGLRGEKVWQPHREHFYQRAVQNGWTHAQVSLAVAGAGAALVALATLAANGRPLTALAAAGAVVAVLLSWLAKGRPPAARGTPA